MYTTDIQPVDYLTAISWGLLGLVGIVGNTFLLSILFKSLKHSKPYEKVIFASLLTDLCNCINFACLQPYGILSRSVLMCKSTGFFFALLTNMNQVWIAINAFSRYMAFYHKELYSEWFNTRGILICYIIALIANMIVFMPIFYYNAFGLNDRGYCGIISINAITIACSLFTQALTVGSAITCACFTYSVIKKIKSHMLQGNLMLDTGLVEDSRQIIKWIAVSTMIPILIQCPTTVIKVVQYFIRVNRWYSHSLTTILPLVPASAPFVTAFIIRPYRRKVMKFFKRNNKITTTNIARINVINRH